MSRDGETAADSLNHREINLDTLTAKIDKVLDSVKHKSCIKVEDDGVVDPRFSTATTDFFFKESHFQCSNIASMSSRERRREALLS